MIAAVLHPSTVCRLVACSHLRPSWHACSLCGLITPLCSPMTSRGARAAARRDLGPRAVLAGALRDRAGPVYLKCENLQRTGSFKVRGAYDRIARLSDAERARGVVAASAGNHAQGVAFAAGLLGASATVVMPERAPIPKVEATRGYGAAVILHGASVEDALAEALRSRPGPARSSFTRSTTRTSWRARGRSGSRSSSSARRCGRSWSGGRRRLAAGVTVAVTRSTRRCGWSACSRRQCPAWSSLAAGHPVQVEPGRRWPTDRGPPAGRHPVRHPRRPGRPGGGGLGGGAPARTAALPGAGQAGGGARGGPGWRRCWRASGAFEPPVVVVLSGGNSTRCCCPSCCGTGSRRPGGSSASAAAFPTSGLAGGAARAAGRSRRQRARGQPRAAGPAAARGRGRGRAPGRDPRTRALRRRHRRAARRRIHPRLRLSRRSAWPSSAVPPRSAGQPRP